MFTYANSKVLLHKMTYEIQDDYNIQCMMLVVKKKILLTQFYIIESCDKKNRQSRKKAN